MKFMIYDNFLNEENLKLVVKDIFNHPTSKFSSPLYKNTNMDFCVEFSYDHPIRKIINDYSETIKLIIEFDGIYHFNSNLQIIKDFNKGLGLSCWKKLEDTIYGIRIPYYIQLDQTMMNFWFGIDKSYTTYKHGFIEKKVMFPTQYTRYGELRFVKELKTIPFNVGKDVFDTILKKMHNGSKNAFEDVITYDIFCSLYKYFYKNDYEFYIKFDYESLTVEEKKEKCKDPIFYLIRRFEKKFETINSWLNL